MHTVSSNRYGRGEGGGGWGGSRVTFPFHRYGILQGMSITVPLFFPGSQWSAREKWVPGMTLLTCIIRFPLAIITLLLSMCCRWTVCVYVCLWPVFRNALLLSPRLFSKTTQMISGVFQCVSPVNNIVIVSVSFQNRKDTWKTRVNLNKSILK